MYLAVGPEAIPAAEATASLALILAFCVAWGMRRIWAASIGWLFTTLADLLDRVRLPSLIGGGHIFGAVSSFLRSIDKNVQHALAVVAMRCEAGAAWLFNQAWSQLLWMAREIASLAHAVDHALGNVSTTIVKPAVRILDKKAQAQINALAGKLVKLGHLEIARLSQAIRLLDRHIAKAYAIPAHAIAGLSSRVGKTERQLRREARQIGKLEEATVGLGAVALVGTALARLGISWVRCNNWKRIGRAGCSMDSNLLSSLLLDLSVLTIAFNIETFARELQEITGEAAHLIQDFAE